MSLSFKKYAYKYEYLTLELQEVEEKYTQYQREWSSLFLKYFPEKTRLAYQNEETGEIRFSLDADAAKGTKPKSTKLRKLYYKISSKVHPDKGGSSEEFEAVNEAYEKSDYIELLKLAEKQGIDVNIDSEDKQLFEDSCNSLEQKIKSKKGSLTWKYFNSDKVIKRVIIDQLVTEYQLKIPEKDIEKLLVV